MRQKPTFSIAMVKRYKKEDEVSYTLGATVTMELLNKRPKSVRAVYVSPRSDVRAVEERAREIGVPVVVGDKAFNILNAKGNCFAIGEFAKFESELDGGDHVVLVNPSDSGNLGTVMRTAAAFGLGLAVIRPSVDPFDPKTVRSSMGALFDIRFALFDSFGEYEKKYGGREIVPFMLNGKPLREKTFERGKTYSLVLGNEATGLPQEFEKYGAVKIEQSDKVDSLNLSIAAAIAMYKLSSERRI